MGRHEPVDEARAPGFTTGLILGERSRRKSTDQRIPSGQAITRILPPKAGRFLQCSPDQRFPGNREEKSGDVAIRSHSYKSHDRLPGGLAFLTLPAATAELRSTFRDPRFAIVRGWDAAAGHRLAFGGYPSCVE